MDRRRASRQHAVRRLLVDRLAGREGRRNTRQWAGPAPAVPRRRPRRTSRTSGWAPPCHLGSKATGCESSACGWATRGTAKPAEKPCQHAPAREAASRAVATPSGPQLPPPRIARLSQARRGGATGVGATATGPAGHKGLPDPRHSRPVRRPLCVQGRQPSTGPWMCAPHCRTWVWAPRLAGAWRRSMGCLRLWLVHNVSSDPSACCSGEGAPRGQRPVAIRNGRGVQVARGGRRKGLEEGPSTGMS